MEAHLGKLMDLLPLVHQQKSKLDETEQRGGAALENLPTLPDRTMSGGTGPSGKEPVCEVEKELSGFDFVQFVVPDVHGIPRGRLVHSDVLARSCRHGVGLYWGIQWYGIQSEVPSRLKEFDSSPNGTLRPLAGTVRAVPWSQLPDRRVGQVMCELQMDAGQPQTCSRMLAQRQVDRLKETGLDIKSAFEVEFALLHRSTLKPLVRDMTPFVNVEVMDCHLGLFTDLMHTLRDGGVRVEYMSQENSPGQLEITVQPQWGVASADDVFVLRNGCRVFCHGRDLTAAFLPMPFPDSRSSGLHLNHSLWTGDNVNVFQDTRDPQKLSPLARHWIAGLVEHAPALMALSNPTTNCYRRQGIGFAPSVNYWNIDDRRCTFRARVAHGNVFLENRLPSSACNPYLALASTIAAGLDGVERKLTCPPSGPHAGEKTKPLPTTLSEALSALEADSVLKEALGAKFVDNFLAIKRDIEIKHFDKLFKEIPDVEKQLSLERKYYSPFF